MKPKRIRNNFFLIYCILLLAAAPARSQDSAKKELLLDLAYYMPASRIPYVMIHSKTKEGKKFQPVTGLQVSVYLDNDSSVNLLGRITTDERGEGKLSLPATLKSNWEIASSHNFIGVSESNSIFNQTKSELSITKSKLLIDTVQGAEQRSLEISVLSLKGNEWIPAAGVELKLGIRRLGGSLPISDEETYTTDSTGKVVAEFKRVGMPGDEKGNIIVQAKVEDNSELGNLLGEKTLTWGIKPVYEKNEFNERSLWATRDKAPIWLLIMAGSIMALVWGTIIYLVRMLFKIRSLGKNAPIP
jgi:hypothetical protein